MKIILCSAIKKEIFKIIKYFNADLLLSVKKKYYIYHYNKGHGEIYFIITGIGQKNIKKNLDHFIKEYHPDKDFQWILTGFGGAISNDLKIGEIVIPSIIRNEKEVYKINPDEFDKSRRKACLFEVDRIYGEKEKAGLKERYPDIDIIDMESASFCEIMEKNNFKKYFIYRSITDDPGFRFPDFRLIKDSIFKIKSKDLLYALLKDIREIKYLTSLYRNISLASGSIYKYFIKYYEDQYN